MLSLYYVKDLLLWRGIKLYVANRYVFIQYQILRVEAIYKFTAYFFAIFGDATKGTILIQQ